MKNTRTPVWQLSKIQSAIDNSRNSRNAKTGYIRRGNSAMLHAKARAMSNGDNGSHM